MGRPCVDLSGKRFGTITVIKRGENSSSGDARWHGICDCGRPTFSCGYRLVSGKVHSCRGCACKKNATTHGATDTKEFYAWSAMIQRCCDPQSESYKDYGARGIKVCKRWRNFEAFIGDMGKAPSKELTLDRIDNDGDYTPENCRWATMREQANNRRNNNIFEFNGQSKTVAQWARAVGLEYHTLRRRIFVSRWPIERALTTPVTHPRKIQ